MRERVSLFLLKLDHLLYFHSQVHEKNKLAFKLQQANGSQLEPLQFCSRDVYFFPLNIAQLMLS